MNIIKEKNQTFAGPQTDYRSTKKAMPLVLDEHHDWKSHSKDPDGNLKSEKLMGVDQPFLERPNLDEHELNPAIAKKQYSPTSERLDAALDGGLDTDVTKDAHS